MRPDAPDTRPVLDSAQKEDAPCSWQAGVNSMTEFLTTWRGSAHPGALRTAFRLPAPETRCRMATMAVPAIQTAPTWARTLRHLEAEETDAQRIASAFPPQEEPAPPSYEQPIARGHDFSLAADAAPGVLSWDRNGLTHSAVTTQRGEGTCPGIVEGTVLRITFRAADSGFAVLKVRAIKQQGLPAEQHLNGAQRQHPASREGRRRQQTQAGIITVTGIFPDVSAGQVLRFEGDWVDHTTHGRQLQSMRCIRHTRTFLSSCGHPPSC